MVAGWVAASACCRVVSAKVLGGVVVSTGGSARILRRSCQKSEVSAVRVPAVVSACVGMVPVEVVGEVSARVSVKVARVTT